MTSPTLVYQVDAFTRRRFAGNPAGVVLNASSLTTADMQHIARELNNSETAFVLPVSNANPQVRLRYFTPTVEVPSCGHATIAAHYVRAVVEHLAPCTFVQESAAGMLPISVTLVDGDFRIAMTQRPPTFEPPFANSIVARICRALSLPEGDLLDCPVQIVSTGHSKILVGVRSQAVLEGLAPDMSTLVALSRDLGCNGFFLFALDTSDDSLAACRMFAPAIGIPEDPVTGNGHGPLGSYLVKHRIVQTNDNRLFFRSTQGHSVGRPGEVRVQVDVEDGEPIAVSVAGDAVIVFAGQLLIDELPRR